MKNVQIIGNTHRIVVFALMVLNLPGCGGSAGIDQSGGEVTRSPPAMVALTASGPTPSITPTAGVSTEASTSKSPISEVNPTASISTSYVGPLTISRGGVYSGQWESMNSKVAAVTIATRDHVTLENCELRGRGDLIKITEAAASVTIRRCSASGLNPMVTNAYAGRFVHANKPKSLTIENNTFTSTSGIYINGEGDHNAKISIRFNDVKNIDGRLSDGNNSYNQDFHRVQFVQFDKVRSCNGCEISWNRVFNEPSKSRVEDNINIYLSSGTPSKPIEIRGNLIAGAYSARPEVDDFSGGGIIIDGDAVSPSDASSYIRIIDNSIVSTSNYGIAIASGFEIDITGNRVFSSGRLESGELIASSNVGVYVWDINSNSPRGAFYAHRVTGNLVGWMNSRGERNDVWFPDCSAAQCVQQPSIAELITSSAEKREIQNWQVRMTTQGLRVGP